MLAITLINNKIERVTAEDILHGPHHFKDTNEFLSMTPKMVCTIVSFRMM